MPQLPSIGKPAIRPALIRGRTPGRQPGSRSHHETATWRIRLPRIRGAAGASRLGAASMAKKITGYIKLQVPAGAANPSPPIGPALGQRGLNIMEFCKAFNAQTQK